MQESFIKKEESTPQNSLRELVDKRIKYYGGNSDVLGLAQKELPGPPPEVKEKINKFREALAKMSPENLLKILEDLALLGEFNGDLSGTAFGDKPSDYKGYAERARETVLEYLDLDQT